MCANDPDWLARCNVAHAVCAKQNKKNKYPVHTEGPFLFDVAQLLRGAATNIIKRRRDIRTPYAPTFPPHPSSSFIERMLTSLILVLPYVGIR
jgi:hypothetical protein